MDRERRHNVSPTFSRRRRPARRLSSPIPTQASALSHFVDKRGEIPSDYRLRSDQNKQGIPLFVPEKKRSVNILPYLLADHAAYVLATPHKKTERRALEMHRRFVTLVEHCARSTQDLAVPAVSHIQQSLDTSAIELPEDLDP